MSEWKKERVQEISEIVRKAVLDEFKYKNDNNFLFKNTLNVDAVLGNRTYLPVVLGRSVFTNETDEVTSKPSVKNAVIPLNSLSLNLLIPYKSFQSNIELQVKQELSKLQDLIMVSCLYGNSNLALIEDIEFSNNNTIILKLKESSFVNKVWSSDCLSKITINNDSYFIHAEDIKNNKIEIINTLKNLNEEEISTLLKNQQIKNPIGNSNSELTEILDTTKTEIYGLKKSFLREYKNEKLSKLDNVLSSSEWFNLLPPPKLDSEKLTLIFNSPHVDVSAEENFVGFYVKINLNFGLFVQNFLDFI